MTTQRIYHFQQSDVEIYPHWANGVETKQTLDEREKPPRRFMSEVTVGKLHGEGDGAFRSLPDVGTCYAADVSTVCGDQVQSY